MYSAGPVPRKSFARRKTRSLHEVRKVETMAVPTVRRLVAGDEAVVARLAEREPQTALLADERTLFVVAFDGDAPVGFAFGYVLPRRHGDAEILFVYEVEVDEGHRRQGTATRLLRELERLARERGVREAFVLADADNDPAAGLYASVGGEPVDVVQWEFRYPGG